ncbi:hypothetical protein NA56DRAFT_651535 [Hyaloscypha hepaticicola]|uniref:DUF7136 domain-containing protein n=1 Tax=Hyaloscypha hepaticicola TaxID=2082293 RepID=A0A2J6PIN6_9HELO|nr:hypothetical protein NA56DRAFT_651535 [Hyaloscypha hepaticicola]
MQCQPGGLDFHWSTHCMKTIIPRTATWSGPSAVSLVLCTPTYTTPTIDATTFFYYGINDTLLPEGDWNVVLSVSMTTCTESSDEITWNSGPVGSTQITFSTANDGTELEELVPQGGGTPGNGLGNVEVHVGSQISSGCPILGTPPQGAIQLAVGSKIISYAPSPTPILGLSTSTTSFVSSTGRSPASSESSTGSVSWISRASLL